MKGKERAPSDAKMVSIFLIPVIIGAVLIILNYYIFNLEYIALLGAMLVALGTGICHGMWVMRQAMLKWFVEIKAIKIEGKSGKEVIHFLYVDEPEDKDAKLP